MPMSYILQGPIVCLTSPELVEFEEHVPQDSMMEAREPRVVDVTAFENNPPDTMHANILAIGDGICKGLAALMTLIAAMHHHGQNMEAPPWFKLPPLVKTFPWHLSCRAL